MRKSSYVASPAARLDRTGHPTRAHGEAPSAGRTSTAARSAPKPPVGAGGVAGASSPSPGLPGSHFAAALVFLVGGGAGLAAVAPELAAGAFLSPRVTGVTHLFTLGWITTSIMGALYQLLPVALERPVRWPGLAWATLLVWAPGLVTFVAGLVLQRAPVLLAGALLISAGVLLFCLNLGATLARTVSRDVTWWALAAACFFLLLTMVVGVALAANLRWPFMGAHRLTALATHVHVALVGWVLLVVVGVAQRLLPMFLLSHGVSPRPGQASVAMLACGTLLLFLLHHHPGPAARLLPAALMLGGAAAFLVQARAFYARRKRPRLDAGMGLAAGGLVLLGAAAALGGWLALTGFHPPTLATAYVSALVLALTLFVAGHHYKIVPFLVWYHRFGPLAGRRPVPTVFDLYSARRAWLAATLLGVGAAGLPFSVALSAPTAGRAAAVLFTLGAALEAAQLAGVARRRPR